MRNADSPCPHAFSQALQSWQVHIAAVLRKGELLMSHIQRSLLSHPCHPDLGTFGIASALFKGYIPEVLPRRYSRSPVVPLSSTKQQLPLSLRPWRRCWLKRCWGPREANSVLTSPTALTARRVAQAQANLEARARRVTIPVTPVTAAWVVIGGCTPWASATEQTRDTKSQNAPSTEEQIKALPPLLITFPFC